MSLNKNLPVLESYLLNIFESIMVSIFLKIFFSAITYFIDFVT